MLYIGCTGFDEHTILSEKTKTSLYDYARYFPIVELDTSFYFIPTEQAIAKWLNETPSRFRFIFKVPAIFTTHKEITEDLSLEIEAQRLLERLAPLEQAGRLYCLLAQFPPQFTCTTENVLYLETLRRLFKGQRIAIEFRHRSWYEEAHRQTMYRFMYSHQFSLVAADEPKKLPTTIPFDETVTNPEFVLCRLHGRNDAGWIHTGKEARKYRTLYRYSASELATLAGSIKTMHHTAKEVAVVFNNNSGGDAAENALQLIKQLQVHYEDLHPTQLDLF